MKKQAIIIPVASGKGGVGKSIISANLAISIANLGHSTVAIDLDLGGSNLYSYLGLENIYPGIGDYLVTKKGKLTDYLVPTNFPNLQFLAGERRVAFMANMPHAQKVKLIKEIKNISADYILLDLGAGTTFNTLDYFELSSNGIVISTFERPSIINTLSFIKNFIYRIVQKEIRNNNKISVAIDELSKNYIEDDLLLLSTINNLIKEMDAELALKIEEKCNTFHPRIIFNMGEHPDDLTIINALEKSVKKILSIDLCFFGYIFYDKYVKLSASGNQVLLEKYPECTASLGITQIARRIIKYKNQNIENSSKLLQIHTLENYNLWKAGILSENI
ncbi:MAG: P-loop NTPase [Bacteroidales bacterium]|nr:P-loop NTPase [Bacteroidales bacterium]